MRLVGLDHPFPAVDGAVLGLFVGMEQESDSDPDEAHAQYELQEVGIGKTG